MTTLKLENQEIGLKFGMYSARYLSTKLSNGYCFDGENLTEIGIAHVVYSGYLNYCAVKDEPSKVTFEQIVDYVESSISDASKVDALTSVVKVWSESQVIKSAQEETKKKKISRK